MSTRRITITREFHPTEVTVEIPDYAEVTCDDGDLFIKEGDRLLAVYTNIVSFLDPTCEEGSARPPIALGPPTMSSTDLDVVAELVYQRFIDRAATKGI